MVVQVGIPAYPAAFAEHSLEELGLKKGEYILAHGVPTTSKKAMTMSAFPDSASLDFPFWAAIAQAAKKPLVLAVPREAEAAAAAAAIPGAKVRESHPHVVPLCTPLVRYAAHVALQRRDSEGVGAQRHGGKGRESEFGFGTGAKRQKMVLERRTPPKHPRRTCRPRYTGYTVGGLKRPRESSSPTRVPRQVVHVRLSGGFKGF